MIDRRIYTHTGRLVDLFDPKTEDIDPDDIAHALANLCRFNGHCRRFYSVAQHSIHVARLAKHRWGLLHDAAEAYLGDWPRPIKSGLGWALGRDRLGKDHTLTLNTSERRLLVRIAERFGCHAAYGPGMTAADDRALATELRDLIHPDGIARADRGMARELRDLPDPDPIPLDPWPPERAAAELRHAFRENFPEAFE